MLKKALVFLIVIILGFGSGYFSTPIRNFIWNALDGGKVQMADIDISGTSKSKSGTGNAGPSEQYISESRAINAVKGLSFLVNSEESANTDFAVEQKPSEAYPVWLIEVKKSYSDKIPEIMYVQVDAVSGNVLDLSEDEMKIAGVGLSMTRREVEKVLGKTRKTKKLYDKALGQSVRIDDYDGLQITYNAKGTVIEVQTAKSEFAGPKGVKIGDSREQVLKLLGRARSGPANLLSYFPLDDNDQHLNVKMENNNICELTLQPAVTGKQDKSK